MLFGLRLWRDSRAVNAQLQERANDLAAAAGQAKALAEQNHEITELAESGQQRMTEAVWRLADGDYGKPAVADGVSEQFMQATRTLAARLSPAKRLTNLAWLSSWRSRSV